MMAEKDSYLLSRNHLASLRLNTQHYLRHAHTSYLLHPSIQSFPPPPFSTTAIEIADVGCGTGIWLISLANSHVHANVKLTGFDISPAQFPPAGWRPQNLELRTLDITKKEEIPAELKERFDVVHVGLVVMVVRKNDPVPVLEGLMALLKPGGYLQWEEGDVASLHNKVPADQITTVQQQQQRHRACDRFNEHWNEWCRKVGLEYGWTSTMDTLFASHGLNVVSYERFKIRDEMTKAWTDSQMMACAEVLENAIVPMAMEKPGFEEPSAKGWRRMFAEMLEETTAGVGVVADLVVCLGKKPL